MDPRNEINMYVCMYMCVCVCVCVCMGGWVGGWMDGWMDGWMHACMYVCMRVPKFLQIIPFMHVTVCLFSINLSHHVDLINFLCV
jgi:hypothetical protein